MGVNSILQCSTVFSMVANDLKMARTDFIEILHFSISAGLELSISSQPCLYSTKNSDLNTKQAYADLDELTVLRARPSFKASKNNSSPIRDKQ